MRSAIVLLAVLFVGCNTNNQPTFPDSGEGIVGPQGPQGEPGIQGERGPEGPQGPQGIQGPPGNALVNLTMEPAGNNCQAGGVKLTDADGGSFYICNAAPGAKGDRGDQGPQGTQGQQGPPGPPTSSLSVYGIDGGIVGQAMANSLDSSGYMSAVYLKEQGCVARVDYSTNRVVPWEGRILYTGLNCTGTAFIKQGTGSPNFPLTCLGAGSQVVKAIQPVMVQQMNAQSAYYVFSTSADGGQTVGCYQYTDTGGFGVAAQPVMLPGIEGPFSFGMP